MKRTNEVLTIAIVAAFGSTLSTPLWAESARATSILGLAGNYNSSSTRSDVSPSDTELNRVSNTTNASDGVTNEVNTPNRVGNPSGAPEASSSDTGTTDTGTATRAQTTTGTPSDSMTQSTPRSPSVQDMQHPAVQTQTAQNDTSGTRATGTTNEGATNGSTRMSNTGTRWDEDGSRSWLPYTSHGYVGLNLGWVDVNTRCDGPYHCDNPDLAGKVYVGGLISRIFGIEVGYVNANLLDDSGRNGGVLRAQGVNVSLVGNIPLGDYFNVFGKVGTTYGWTKTSAGPGSTVSTGKDHGFGLSYGAGLGYDVTRHVQLVGEWDRQEFKFAEGREHADMYTLGVKWKF